MPLSVRPRVVFVTDSGEISLRQMQALISLHEKGSMKKAAQAMGISTPVLYKYVREVEVRAGSKLINTSSRGSELTEDGVELIGRFRALELRLEDQRPLRIACTLVSERCVLTAASYLSKAGVPSVVSISTDEANLRSVDERRADCIVLDDALYAMERSIDTVATEIGSDLLLHRDAGKKYARLAFGAQRLGFRHLESNRVPFQIAQDIFEPSLLDQTDLSYFVNRSLVRRGVVKASGAREQKWSVHSVVAIPCAGHPDLPAFLGEASRIGLYPKG